MKHPTTPAQWSLSLLVLIGIGAGCANGAATRSIADRPTGPEFAGAEAPAAPREPSPSRAAAENRERELTRLAQVLEDAIGDYEEGIALLESGDEIEGEGRIAVAATALGEAARDCAAAPGCSLERFLGAYEKLLTWQEIALKRQAVRIGDLETAAEEPVDREPGTSAIEASIPEIGRTAAMLRGTDLSEILALNGPVSAALEDWLTWMRPMLLDSWHHYQFLRSSIAPVYEEAGLPEALLFAMIATETGGRVHSVSRAGAAGLLQFMPSTGRQYGLHVVDGFDLRYDPVAATRANVRYLEERFRELNDNLELSLAAYNGGEGRVRGLARKLPGVSLWDPRFFYALPDETREYVPRILAAAWLFLHPERYNVVFPALPTDTTTLSLAESTSLVELTICLGQDQHDEGWFRVLRNLNPRLGPDERLEPGREIRLPSILVSTYERQCTAGPFVEIARELRQSAPQKNANRPSAMTYVVRSGDTLGRIATRHRCASVAQIAQLNNLRGPHFVVRKGQKLRIPTCS